MCASNELHVVLRVPLGDQDVILDNLRSVMVSMAELSAFYEVENGAPKTATLKVGGWCRASCGLRIGYGSGESPHEPVMASKYQSKLS